MSPKNGKNKMNNNHITRSKSKTRDEKEGAASADPHPNALGSAVDTSCSNSRDGIVPPQHQNKVHGEEVNTMLSLG